MTAGGSREGCGISCIPSLDGDKMSSHILGPEKIIPGRPTEIPGEIVQDVLHPFLFGKKNIVGRPNLPSSLMSAK